MEHKLETYSFSLGPGSECPSGTFVLDVSTGRCDWTDGLYAIHGYTRGEIVPTVELALAHTHAEDREPVRRLISDIFSYGGQGATFHRIIDSTGNEHRVLTVAQAYEGREPITPIHGVTIDLTRSVDAEAGRAASAAVAGAYASRAVIEQAKGIIMGLLDVQSDKAFSILATRSQHTNTKLAAVASELTRAAGHGALLRTLRRWGIPS
jgi:ANTAR domain/PAS fold